MTVGPCGLIRRASIARVERSREVRIETKTRLCRPLALGIIVSVRPPNPQTLSFRSVSVFAVSIAIAYLTACSLEPKSSRTTLHLTIPGPANPGIRAFDRVTPPASLNDFSCLAVNVTGPGIPDSGRNPERNPGVVFDRLLRRESYCSYRGVIGGPVFPQGGAYGPAEVAVSVPAGALRLVQVVGIAEAAGCVPGQIALEPDGSTGRYYEVGRAVLSGVFNDVSASISEEWTAAGDQSARALDCDEGGCQVTQQNLEENADYITDTGSAYRLGQQFPFAGLGKLRAITIKAYGQVAGPATIDVYANVTTPFPQPTGGVLASATATVPGSGGGAQEVRFDFGAGASLPAGTYWMVLHKGSGGTDFLTWSGSLNSMAGRDPAVKGPDSHSYATLTSPAIQAFYHRIEVCPN